MKKRQWKVRRDYVTQPDAQYRWDRSYQLLIQWSGQALKERHLDPLLQEDLNEDGDICSGFDDSDKPKPKQSNNS